MTAEQRHRCMSHIRSKGTKPEMKVRRWLWHHGYRYRLNVKSVPGKPDIVMRPYRTAIFVNGCFWHGHNVELKTESGELRTESGKRRTENTEVGMSKCVNALMCECVEDSACCKIPQTNREFWVNKIRRNKERDQENYDMLYRNGWKVIVIWECQLTATKIEHTMREVELLLNENMLSLYKKQAPKPYTTEDSPLPLAAEEETSYGGK